MKKIFIFLLLIFLGSSAYAKEQTKIERAEALNALATEYYSSYAQLDWEKMASLFIPEEFAKLANLIRGITKPLGLVEQNASDIEIFGALYEWYFKSNPDTKTYIISHKAKILGKVAENENIVHVLIRVESSPIGYTYSKVEVLTAVKHKDKWYLKIPEEINILNKAVKR